MEILVYLIAAIILAWLVTDLTHNRGILLFNVIVASIATYLAGNFLTPYFHVRTINAPVNLNTMLVTLFGVLVILLAFNLYRGGRRRW
jgi:uncharacterized membrane protein YeaQ/YmgE (transglycosylase-associated protein family)